MATISAQTNFSSSSGQAQVEVHEAGPIPAVSGREVTKVIVAIHGVGDQHSFGTLQSVVNRFCSYHHAPAAVPLGSFHTKDNLYCLPDWYPREQFQHLAFAEVYWADIPRAVVKERYTLEEAKNWARTIVERMRMRQKAAQLRQGPELPASERRAVDAEFQRIKFIMTEMIESLAVAERFCYLAEKASLFTFDLRKLLDNYLGDVQVVTEFGTARGQILTAFDKMLTRVHEAYPGAEIHIVAHSEGTVVSLLGLLQALHEPGKAPWLEQVRGFMTLGSPIDKHIVLWEDLFSWPEGAGLERKQDQKIHWRNYYDFGDPIGFNLDEARNRLEQHNLKGVFEFEDQHDHGFARYQFPGKAHVDYWEDEHVFGHFIRTVVNRNESPERRHDVYTKPPGSKLKAQLISYTLPYVGVLGMLFGAAYVVFKALLDYFFKNYGDVATKAGQAVGEVAAAANAGAAAAKPLFSFTLEKLNSDYFVFASALGGMCLLGGLTLVGRLPRLKQNSWVQVGAWVGALAGLGLGWLLLAGQLASADATADWADSLDWLRQHSQFPLLTLAGALVAYLTARFCTHWGMVPLLVLGALGVGVLVWEGTHMMREDQEPGPLWPVLLATAVALYVWWLAALLFDMVCVWHASIRQSACVQHITQMMEAKPLPDAKAHAAQKPTLVKA
ncbi:hypothetical protein LJ737_14095 [Hymenobacter sp. 15J16-1T3B]|uniref:hypothetical protein n=1 Tax=Hymenobacter sp. 15J16-1T3B TaxID=2886941 RepID=UPI001D0F50CF|nr:hypothetical protein [Hymenobacter sp. 15J16-1T3B]MCC3158376.1 hypothetical protein [Hymenobacter sp. 15J16-1T3B]